MFQEDELHHFSKVSSTHYRSRWLRAKNKKALAGSDGTVTQQQRKKHMTLDMIDEDIETSEEPVSAQFTELIVQWTHQRLPLPIHWFLSPLMTMPDPPEVVKAGLFFFLGLEAISCAEGTMNPSPIELVPLVWKILDKMRSEPETGKKNYTELLRFLSNICGSYSTFVEAVIDQFAAESYGDALYGCQVAIYLHRGVELQLDSIPGTYFLMHGAMNACWKAYVNSWVSGALDRAATRRSMAFTLFLHHISSFIFMENMEDHTPFRNRLVKSMSRHCSVKRENEGVMLDQVRYVPFDPRIPRQDEALRGVSDASGRFQVLTDASEGNSSLTAEVDRLTSTLTEDKFQ
ncbi:hypothetical protein MLD38_013516 [Melastoma candidum]|uniref:Uncharacterized protein n=1 Tax=Melastoma candidum TaxID=119954 RepID=A0ACB9R9S9_9MYRT|nr:hypothetical protein MLD38_013516 [Melastoma candidum]